MTNAWDMCISFADYALSISISYPTKNIPSYLQTISIHYKTKPIDFPIIIYARYLPSMVRYNKPVGSHWSQKRHWISYGREISWRTISWLLVIHVDNTLSSSRSLTTRWFSTYSTWTRSSSLKPLSCLDDSLLVIR